VPPAGLRLAPADDLTLVVDRDCLALSSAGERSDITARVAATRGPLAALLEVAIAPTPLTSDDAIA
jgi:hypothetical protein